jgi:tRNA modification GTPase
MHHIDFPEEDDAPVPIEKIAAEGREVLEALVRLGATAPEGELLREGALVVLAGRPNSGKSSLFNAFLGQERAIVTDLPGTTRDALESVVQLGGFPFRLVDTAGLREASELVERLGIEVAERYLSSADVILYCVESSRELDPEEVEFLGSLGDCPVLVLSTMSDLQDDPANATVSGGGSTDVSIRAGASADVSRERIRVSVVSGSGLDDLKERLPALVYSGLVRLDADSPVLTRERQARAVGEAERNLRSFLEALEAEVPAELASTHLRPAETALEELLGVISTDDVFDVVFSEFCLGK